MPLRVCGFVPASAVLIGMSYDANSAMPITATAIKLRPQLVISISQLLANIPLPNFHRWALLLLVPGAPVPGSVSSGCSVNGPSPVSPGPLCLVMAEPMRMSDSSKVPSGATSAANRTGRWCP